MMDIDEAIERVWQLANENALDPNDPEVIECELVDEANKQQLALNLVHDFAVEHDYTQIEEPTKTIKEAISRVQRLVAEGIIMSEAIKAAASEFETKLWKEFEP